MNKMASNVHFLLRKEGVSFKYLVKRAKNFMKYNWLSLSRPRLSRITAYLEKKIRSLPKHENLTTCKKKYCGKEE